MKKSLEAMARKLLAVAACVGAGTAQAHTGHDTSSLFAGLIHPFGLDHLLAMVAVGVWSVAALPARKAWLGPMTFMVALIVSAGMGAAGITVPFLESLIAASVVLFGLMLVLSRTQLPAQVGLGLIAAAASLHGLAHGAETPETGFATYALGFLATTAVLHCGGVMAGLGMRRYCARQESWAFKLFGVGCGGDGLYLLSQL